jgi:hypothetical protein
VLPAAPPDFALTPYIMLLTSSTLGPKGPSLQRYRGFERCRRLGTSTLSRYSHIFSYPRCTQLDSGLRVSPLQQPPQACSKRDRTTPTQHVWCMASTMSMAAATSSILAARPTLPQFSSLMVVTTTLHPSFLYNSPPRTNTSVLLFPQVHLDY